MLNSAIIMGRLTADPELRTTATGLQTVRFTVAVDRNFTKSGEEKKADFISCVAWRQQAEFISKYFSKGSMIAVQGSIQTGSYDDKNGVKRYTTDIIVDRAHFCGGKNEGASAPVAGVAAAPAFSNGSADDFDASVEDDDLPF